MKRDLSTLAEQCFDVVVIGGGIFGACAAHDAAMRGLSVALIEKDDFCSGASANSLKMVHGGIRYLQHADLVRLISSCRERSAMLRIAPHLVQPLPIVIPTYGHGKSGKEFLGAGMLLYDMLTVGRNRGIRDPSRRIPWSHFMGREEVLGLFPDIEDKALTGAAVFSDGQMYNPTRLVLAFIRSAVESGAHVANYAEATGFTGTAERIDGVEVRDALSGDTFVISAKTVLNAAGPWAERLIAGSTQVPRLPPVTYSRDACFVIRRRSRHPFAIAIQGRTHDPDAVLSRPARHLFMAPWRDYQLIGVWHVVYDRGPEEVIVTDGDLLSFIDEINWAYPALNLSLDDVLMWNAGLVPFGENEEGAENLSYGKRSHLIDHVKTNGPEGLVTLIGIRYTTARGDSAKAVDLIGSKLGGGMRRAPTDTTPLFGGDIADFEALVRMAAARGKPRLREDINRALVQNYGTDYVSVLRYAAKDPALAETLGDSRVIKAEVLHAIDEEMALSLADVAFRRTDLATGSDPGRSTLEECARLMAAELGWDEKRIAREVSIVESRFPRFGSAATAADSDGVRSAAPVSPHQARVV
jgi:glycerol-3-phosphate dehydrogenase